MNPIIIALTGVAVQIALSVLIAKREAKREVQKSQKHQDE